MIRLALSAFIGIAPEHKLRVIAPGRGRRLRLQDLPLRRGDGLHLGRQEGGPAHQVDRRALASPSSPTPTAATTSPPPSWRSTATARSWRCGSRPRPTWAPISRPSPRSVPTYLYAPLLSGQYNIPAIYCEVDGVYTNTAPVDAYRGAGRPEATFVVERLVEVAARQTGQRPGRVPAQELHHSRSRTRRPSSWRTTPATTAPASTRRWSWPTTAACRPARPRASRRACKRGIGFSAYIEACGIAPSQAVGSLGAGVGLWESAEVRVNPTGSVEVLTGSHSHGQGHETTFAQLVSERLGIPIEQVTVVHGDTDKVQFGMGTYGSRSGAVGMTAIYKAIDKVIVKAKKVAGFVLEVPEETVAFNDGIFSSQGHQQDPHLPRGGAAGLHRPQVHGRAAGAGPQGGRVPRPHQLHLPLRGAHLRGRDRPGDGRDPHRPLDRGGRLRHPDQPDDRGRPGARRRRPGRRPGAAGGRATTTRRPASSSPRASWTTPCRTPTTCRRSRSPCRSTPCPSNPLGIKGCGEAGAIAAPAAVINAITDALGHEDIAMPATPADGLARRAEVARQDGRGIREQDEPCTPSNIFAPSPWPTPPSCSPPSRRPSCWPAATRCSPP